ncbi:SubName: Full=Related to GPI-anchor transamidase complex subunit Gpi16 {ECO:0000313/EMBL:CCA75436.1} [Serendipita indica DSM 11827]|nr:SubName: Full=Related to GPI-anchor transamidase complex subunit Gpi16 {ECO:0000313/EMBL:CCA75436.1} [Serendipita indica DSM 11827]
MRRYSPLPWTILHLLILIITPVVSSSHQGPSESKAQPGDGQQPTQASFSTSQPKEMAKERLLLKPLKDGKIAAHFEFDYLDAEAVPRDPRTLGERDVAQHFDSFPLSLGQILREYAVAEMHLTLNSGRWQYDTWGYPQSPAVASGAELWVWMADGGEKSIEERWSGLSNALAGLFCASLSALPTSRTTSPRYAFRPEGQLPFYPFDEPSAAGTNKTQDGLDYVLRHAILPSENICTENLTPFIKLLPCKSYAGIAELLNPHKLFGGWWYGVGVHATWNNEIKNVDKSTSQAGVRLQLTVGAVLDGSAVHQDSKQWSFRSLFDREIQRTCAVTGPGEVQIRQPSESGGSDTIVLSPAPANRIVRPSTRNREQEIWDVIFVGEHGLRLTATSPISLNSDSSSIGETPLSIKRSLRGYDQTRGGFAISITNRLYHTVDAWYVESIPWIIKPYLSSLRVVSVQYLDASSGSGTSVPLQIDPSILDLSHMNYIPPAPGLNARTTPALLEIPIYLPPRSTIHISLEFEKMFLKYTEHPPDAQRGWDLPGGVLIPVDDERRLGLPRMYTPPLLADLATPDFSMPYNVIILSGALIALLFGMTFNMLTRRFVLVKP